MYSLAESNGSFRNMAQLVVNGEPVSPNSIEQERRQLISELQLENRGISDDRLRLLIFDRVKQNVIDHYLLKQEAVSRKLPVDEEQIEEQVKIVAERNGGLERLTQYLKEMSETIDDFRAHVRDRMFVDKLVEQVYDAIPEPKERHIKRYYKEHRESYNSEEQALVEQIVKTFKNPMEQRKMKAEIEKIASTIQSGKSFKLMVKQKSDFPQNDGQLGWIRRGQLSEEFENFIFSAEPGAVSGPIAGAKGWYLLRVVEKQEPTQRKYEDVKSEIAEMLLEEERKKTLSKLMEQLRKEAVIEG